MSLDKVLENNFKKGAVVFSSSDELKEKKKRLHQYLVPKQASSINRQSWITY